MTPAMQQQMMMQQMMMQQQMMANPAMQMNMMMNPMMNPAMMMQAMQNPQIMQQMMTLLQMMGQEAMKQQLSGDSQSGGMNPQQQQMMQQQMMMQQMMQQYTAMGMGGQPNNGMPMGMTAPPVMPPQQDQFAQQQPQGSTAARPLNPTGSTRRGHHRRGSRGSGSMGKQGFAEALAEARTSPPPPMSPTGGGAKLAEVVAAGPGDRRGRRGKKGTNEHILDGPVGTTHHSGLNPKSEPFQLASTRGNKKKKDPRANAALDAPRNGIVDMLKGEAAKTLPLSTIFGHLCECSLDQHGSRFIQAKLDVATPQDRQTVFEEVLPDALKLMTDVFGNYVIQKLIEHGTDEQAKILASCLTSRVVELSYQMYGCRVVNILLLHGIASDMLCSYQVQKAIEKVQKDQKAELVAELRPPGVVLQCIKDQNGNHVVQKAIEKLDTDVINFIVEAFYGQAPQLASNQHGSQSQRVELHAEILQGAEGSAEGPIVQMMKDQFGNYVVQKMLEHSSGQQRDKLVNCIKESTEELRKDSYGKHLLARLEKVTGIQLQ